MLKKVFFQEQGVVFGFKSIILIEEGLAKDLLKIEREIETDEIKIYFPRFLNFDFQNCLATGYYNRYYFRLSERYKLHKIIKDNIIFDSIDNLDKHNIEIINCSIEHIKRNKVSHFLLLSNDFVKKLLHYNDLYVKNIELCGIYKKHYSFNDLIKEDFIYNFTHKILNLNKELKDKLSELERLNSDLKNKLTKLQNIEQKIKNAIEYCKNYKRISSRKILNLLK